ncbi:hypothetical protein AALP_AA2G181500 [Arabis alpina]|uniref:RNase III domain-containing protein n=1 Tax=Arabis alpina TaxID=50452 RepID=A0A087HIB6_ARAAL|nr:hypothetical protein AALP_AA2G181500 [Arabis alpina]
MDSVETNLQVQEEVLEEEKNLKMTDHVEAVEKILNYSFKKKNLLKAALKQDDNQTGPSFKRLEYLGDSVLTVAIINYLLLTFPDLTDYELSKLHLVNTSNEKFARVAIKRGLLPLIIDDPRNDQLLKDKTKLFVEAVSKEDDLVWCKGAVEAPKALANFVESIAGAVYIDLDFDLTRLWEIFKGLLEPLFMLDDFTQRYPMLRSMSKTQPFMLKEPLVFKCCSVSETYKLIASGRDKTVSHAKIAATKDASECRPVEEIIEEEHRKVEEKKNLKLQESLVEKKDLQMQESLEEKQDMQMLESLGEKKDMQMHESLEEKKDMQMQESLEEKKNLQMDSLEAVEKILNYSFSNKSLLKEAITNESGMKSRLANHGQTAVALAFIKYLYIAYPNLSASGLEQLGSANKSKDKFARVAIKHGLHKFLILLHPHFDEKVKLFSEAVSKEDRPVPYGGLVEAPKFLSNLINSVAGAVYVDVNFHVPRLWEICKDLFEPLYTVDDLCWESKPVLTLINLCDKHGKQIDFKCRQDPWNKYICELYLDDEIIACGRSRLGHKAKHVAAMAALVKLSEKMPIAKVEETVIENTEIEDADAKVKLIEICRKRKWPEPIYSFVSGDAVKGFVYSAEIETPTEEGTLFIKGDRKRRKKFAQSNSASLMIRALEFSLKDEKVDKLSLDVENEVDKGSLDLEKGHKKVEVYHMQTRSCTRKLQLQENFRGEEESENARKIREEEESAMQEK